MVRRQPQRAIVLRSAHVHRFVSLFTAAISSNADMAATFPSGPIALALETRALPTVQSKVQVCFLHEKARVLRVVPGYAPSFLASQNARTLHSAPNQRRFDQGLGPTAFRETIHICPLFEPPPQPDAMQSHSGDLEAPIRRDAWFLNARLSSYFLKFDAAARHAQKL